MLKNLIVSRKYDKNSPKTPLFLRGVFSLSSSFLLKTGNLAVIYTLLKKMHAILCLLSMVSQINFYLKLYLQLASISINHQNRNKKEVKQIVNTLVPREATKLIPFVTSKRPQNVASMYGKSEFESPKYSGTLLQK